ncbi:MAG TPA: DUF3417 domain-containing protein, partial [Bacteroidota bacterium]|nr:DUF3417 domain-containing protein [Bacteroidota bacterium]
MKKKSGNDFSHSIKRLHALAHNVWWSWNPQAQQLFQELSPLIWQSSSHNPVAVLSQFSEGELKARFGDKNFFARVEAILTSFEQYMHAKPSKRSLKEKKKGLVAYFCAEFGLHECLPFYSGGLGVLAGDHVKSASDIGLGLVGVGLFYRQGYFQQHIDPNGYQQESYPTTNPALVPVEQVRDFFGKPLICSVTLGNSPV